MPSMISYILILPQINDKGTGNLVVAGSHAANHLVAQLADTQRKSGL